MSETGEKPSISIYRFKCNLERTQEDPTGFPEALMGAGSEQEVTTAFPEARRPAELWEVAVVSQSVRRGTGSHDKGSVAPGLVRRSFTGVRTTRNFSCCPTKITEGFT